MMITDDFFPFLLLFIRYSDFLYEFFIFLISITWEMLALINNIDIKKMIINDNWSKSSSYYEEKYIKKSKLFNNTFEII